MPDLEPELPIADPLPPPGRAEPDAKAEREPYPRWKKLIIAAAAALLLSGLLLRLVAIPVDDQATSLAMPTTATSLVEGDAGSETTVEQGTSPWSSALMLLGFSFFVGFAMGTVLRMFLRLAIVFVGLVFLVLVGLPQHALVTVNRDALDLMFQSLSERVGADFEQFRTMMTGRLPQAGLGALGLFTGFKRR